MGKSEFSDFQNPEDASFDKLVQAIDRAYHRPWVMMWRSFLHGAMTALGAAVGWILILIASGLIFQALGGIELFKPLLDKLQDTVSEVQQRSASQAQQELLEELQRQQEEALRRQQQNVPQATP